jgi:hypothetical protein
MREGIDLVLKKHEQQRNRENHLGKNAIQEKREYVRVLTNLKAEYSIENKKNRLKKCTIINVHHKGFGLEFHSLTKIKEGESLLFTTFLANQPEPIQIQGTVQWIKERKRYFVGGVKVASSQDEDKLTQLVRLTLGITRREG